MIIDVVDRERGCGWRKPGGLYLVSRVTMKDCCRLPLKLETCPCCGAGIKPSRGWTWIDPGLLFGQDHCYKDEFCILANPGGLGRSGLLWVGEKFYPTVLDFLQEAKTQGISRRIQTVPRGFEVGKTMVFLAHRKAIDGEEPGIFFVFRPSAIEYVTKGDETEETLLRMVNRGITPVRVIQYHPVPKPKKTDV